MELKPEQIQQVTKDLNAEANKLRPGSKTVEWKGFLAVLLCALINPVLKGYLGVGISEEIMIGLIGAVSVLIAGRSFVKR